jgi:hypothetical protein
VRSDLFAPLVRFQERIGLGYNSRTLFAGADLSLTQWLRVDKHGSIELNAARTYIQVFVGYRFRAPSFVKKNTRKIETLVPLLNTVAPDQTEEEGP